MAAVSNDGRSIACCRLSSVCSRFSSTCSVHWSWQSPPGVPKASHGSPSRSANDGDRVVRGRTPGFSVFGWPSPERTSGLGCRDRSRARGWPVSDCSQPPLGVAEIMIPFASTTSRWQVSPRGGPASVPPARPVMIITLDPVRRQLGARPSGDPGRSSSEAVVPDHGGSLVRVRSRQQRRQRDIGYRRIAVPGVPIGESSFAHSVIRWIQPALPGRWSPIPAASSNASCCSITGPRPHGPVLCTSTSP